MDPCPQSPKPLRRFGSYLVQLGLDNRQLPSSWVFGAVDVREPCPCFKGTGVQLPNRASSTAGGIRSTLASFSGSSSARPNREKKGRSSSGGFFPPGHACGHFQQGGGWLAGGRSSFVLVARQTGEPQHPAEFGVFIFLHTRCGYFSLRVSLLHSFFFFFLQGRRRTTWFVFLIFPR